MIYFIPSQKEVYNIQKMSLDNLKDLIRNPKITITQPEQCEFAKLNSGYFYGCSFSANRVHNSNVVDYNFIIMDFDENSNFRNKLEYLKLRNINFLAYTSINHKYKNITTDRFRIILQLSSPISKSIWTAHSEKILGNSAFTLSDISTFADKSTFSSNRGFCLPVKTPFYKYAIFESGENISIEYFSECLTEIQNIKSEMEKKRKRELERTKFASLFDKAENFDRKAEISSQIISNSIAKGIDWSKDNVGQQTNSLMASIIAKLIKNNFTLDECKDFRFKLGRFSFTKIKEWNTCCDNMWRKK